MLPLEAVLGGTHTSEWPSTCPKADRATEARIDENGRCHWTFEHRNEQSGEPFRVTLCEETGVLGDAHYFHSVHLVF